MTVIAIAERALNSINELRMMDASRMESLPKPLTNDLSQPNSTVFLFSQNITNTIVLVGLQQSHTA